jgi:hypothetical protein
MLVMQLTQWSRHVAGVCNRRQMSDTQAPGTASAWVVTRACGRAAIARAHAGDATREMRGIRIFPAFSPYDDGIGGAPAPGTGANRDPPRLLGLKRSKDAFVASWVYYR